MITCGELRALIKRLEKRCPDEFADSEPLKPEYILRPGDGRG